jgi:hypothetical protein
MNKWVYEPTTDADIRDQRDEADETYIGHRYADLTLLAVAVALGGCAVLIGYFAPLLPGWVP